MCPQRSRKLSLPLLIFVFTHVIHLCRSLTINFNTVYNHMHPPHIIFLLADDLGWNDVGYHGRAGSLIKTPFIDKLARKGVRLENYYVQPICSPTRTQLMTGRYQIRMGLQQAKFCPGETLCLPTKEKLLPEQLREFGYATHAVGKWHLGMSRKACLPTRRGFDSFFGIVLGTSDHFTHERTYRINKQPYHGNAFYENENATIEYKGRFCTNLYAERAVKIIKKHDKNKPLFLYVPFQMVHLPDDVPSKFRHLYKNIPDLQRRYYAGRVAALDEAVKNITRALRVRGLYSNSVIIFSTDNGGAIESSASNWPLRGSKGTLWEGGVRAVGFVHSELLPSFVKGTVNNELIHVSDWLPTLVKGVAGGNLSTMPYRIDGYNLWSTISSFKPSPRTMILHELNTLRAPPEWGSQDYNVWGPLSKLPFNATIRAAIREGPWKLITGKAGNQDRLLPSESHIVKEMKSRRGQDVIKLYDVSKDAGETRNVARENRRIVKKMLKKLKSFERFTKKPLESKIDPRSDPALHGGSWTPWLDDDEVEIS